MILPRKVDKVLVPPIKCQGIKTKLVPFIFGNVTWDSRGRWIEPFGGSGVVLFNLKPQIAIYNDLNPYIVDFYKAIFNNQLTPKEIQRYLETEGKKLQENGRVDSQSYYYEVRNRFNNHGSLLDFLFLSRSCFNGVMRFNKKGKFNVPFCHKPNRFSQAYITKITNQVIDVKRAMQRKNWEFMSVDWRKCLLNATENDFVYIDPPYIGRHVDYYNSWTDEDAVELAELTQSLPCGYAVSMWSENKYRKNKHIDENWKGNDIRYFSHFYHVGSTENLRNEMREALIIRPKFSTPKDFVPKKVTQMELFTYSE